MYKVLKVDGSTIYLGGEYSARSEPLCPLERATHSAW